MSSPQAIRCVPGVKQHDSARGLNQIGTARDVTFFYLFGRLSRWKLLAIALGLVIAVTVRNYWSEVTDWARDLSGDPALIATISSPLNAGDSVAMVDQLASDEHGLLLRGPSRQQLRALLDRHRAARVRSMNVVVILQGRRNHPIRIIDVRPRVIAAASNPSGTCLTLPLQGTVEEFEIKADLDRMRPDGTKSRYLPKSIDLTDGERATIDITVTAEQRWYEWEIEVIYIRGSGPEPSSAFFRLSDGQPFRVTGEAPRYATTYHDPSLIGIGLRSGARNSRCP